MSGTDQRAARVQELLTALLKRQLCESLQCVDRALSRWRANELGVFEAHAELLRHAARAERVAERMARAGSDTAEHLLRDAFDAGLVERDEFEQLVGRPPDQVEPSPASEMPDKRSLVEKMLCDGPVLVHIDARAAGVDVPEQFAQDAKLVLRFGYGLTPSIVDLGVDDHAITGTLTFSGVPFCCRLPWRSIYAAVSEVDQKGMVWPEDVPDCVVGELGAVDEDAPASSPNATGPKSPHLKLVK